MANGNRRGRLQFAGPGSERERRLPGVYGRSTLDLEWQQFLDGSLAVPRRRQQDDRGTDEPGPKDAPQSARRPTGGSPSDARPIYATRRSEWIIRRYGRGHRLQTHPRLGDTRGRALLPP